MQMPCSLSKLLTRFASLSLGLSAFIFLFSISLCNFMFKECEILHQEIARFTNSPASSVNCFDLLLLLLLLLFCFFCLVPRLSSAAKDHVEPECAFEVGKNLTVFIEQCISLLHYT